MKYSLKPALATDRHWLDQLRRDAYRDLFDATWGAWDEVRHVRHFSESWDVGHISVIAVDGVRIGMIQLLGDDDTIEIAEIQLLPGQQKHGVGSRVLSDVIESARMQNKRLSLHLGLKNVGAFRLYQRLGFKEVRRTDAQIFMERHAD